MSTPATHPGDDANPWRTTASRRIYDNPWISVREDAVIRPDGDDGIYGVVHMRHVALGVVVAFDDGDTLLVGQHRYALGAYSWEIPEGGGDPSLDDREEAARELLEETGLRARAWTDLGFVHTSNSVTDELGRLFLATGLDMDSPSPDGTERLRYWRLPLRAAVAMALDGRLTDAITVIGLLRADQYLQRSGRAARGQGAS